MRPTLTLLALAAVLALAAASPRCKLRPNGGMCLAFFTKFYWNPSSGRCTKFTWGGCGGVVPFETLSECKKAACKVDPCMLRGKKGTCEAAIFKWQFNQDTKRCEKFFWGGCGGVVPFDTREKCESKCTPSVCNEKPNPGPCLAYFPKYYYDKKTRLCTQFTYGGCKGKVPFDSLKDCLSTCPAKDPCKIEPKAGSCSSRTDRFYFDPNSRTCKKFSGGCENSVPFSSLQDCRQVCPIDRCRLKREAGPCTKSISRFYYDSKSGSCKRFSWSGCGGVVPFKTRDDCEEDCEM